MKTLQIVGDSKFGGATVLLLAWCRFLREQGCEVHVLTTDATTRERMQAIPGVHIVDDVLIPRDVSLVQDTRALLQMAVRMRREGYDVVQTYTAVPGFLGRFAARLANVPVILHHQAGWTINEFASGWKRLVFSRLEYLATLLSTRAICVSQATRQQAEAERLAPLHKLVTICNGIDPTPLQVSGVRCQVSGLKEEGANRQTREPNEKKGKRKQGKAEGGEAQSKIVNRQSSIENRQSSIVIGNSGRLAALKDNDSLLRALPLVQSLLPDTRVVLRLAGEGPEMANLQTLAAELGWTEQVEFVGFTRDIAAFLHSLDVFVSPSLREGLSIALLEAMAAGLPIVTTSIAPNRELIEHDVTGQVVPIRSPEAIAHAIIGFAQNPELAERCGANARRRVLENYTLERMFRETWNLYVSLLAERQPHGAPARTTQPV